MHPSSPLSRFSKVWVILALIVALSAVPAFAVDYSVYLDLDDNATTGCDVVTVDGPVSGVDAVLLTTTTGMQVTAVSRQTCIDPVTDTFSAPVPLTDFPPPWPVGDGNGVFGADVVETYYPFDTPFTTGTVRFAVETDDGTNMDALVDAAVGISDNPIEIPTLSEVSLLLLVALLMAAAAWQLRRRRSLSRVTRIMALLLALGATSFVWAVGVIILDGEVTDWPSAVDGQFTDTTVGGVGASDVLVVFAAFDPSGDYLYLRFDVGSSATPPTAVDDAFTVMEDSGATSLDVLANDTDPDGGVMSILTVTQPANGTVVITNGGADLTYQPDANYCNTPIPPGSPDTFTYTLNGGSSATVSMTVSCEDDAAVANDDTATVTEDDPATTIDVVANDTDLDGDPILVTAVTQPTNGTVVITNGGADLTYQPDADYCNTPIPPGSADTFTYTVTGGDTATVSVTVTCVDDAAVANDDTATVTEDDPATTIDVLANDTDAEGDAFLVTGVVQPTNGTVVITNGGADLTYQPAADYCNTPIPPGSADTFTYTVTGGDMATVGVTVTCEDDAAVANDDTATVTEDDPATTIDVLANDTDPDGDPILVTGVTQPANGTVVITNGGADLTYQPDLDYCNTPIPPGSPDTFTYTVTGGDTATVSVTVTCVADPPMASDNAYETVGNTELVVAGATPTSLARLNAGPGVLANDSDPVEGTAISVTAVGADTTAPFTGTTTLGGDVTMNADGSFVYLPPRGVQNASDTFQYTISNAGGGMDSATVTIDIADARAWYVHNDPAGEPLNPVDGPEFGRSDDPFDTLAAAEAAHGAGDLICVFEGSGTSAGMNSGITLTANNVRLHGEHHGCTFDLALNGNAAPAVVLAPTPTRHAHIGHTAGDSIAVDATGTTVTGIEIRGVELAATGGNALDITTAGSNGVEVTFENSIVRDASAEGVDVNHASSAQATVRVIDVTPFNAVGNAFDARETGTGNLELRLTGNLDVTSTSNTAILVDGSVGAGTTFITAFNGNSVHEDTSNTGVLMDTVIFDDVIGAPLGAINAGDFAIGTMGDGVGGAGMVLDTVTGDLRFGDLDIEAGLGTALTVIGTGEFTGATGFQLTSTSGTLSSARGAVDIDLATVNLQFDSITSTGGANNVALSEVAGFFDANAGSLTGSTGTAFLVTGIPGVSSLTVNYSGTLGNTVGRAIDVNGLPLGTLTFDGASITDSGAGVVVNNMGATLTVSATSNNFTGTSALMVTGNTDGTVNFDDATIGTTGTPISILDGADQIGGTFDFDNVDVTHNAAAVGMDIQGLNGGSVSFDAFSSFTALAGTGFNISSNPNANVTFAAGSTVDFGTLATPISAGTAFNMSGNGATTLVMIPDLDIFTMGQTAINASGSGTLDLDAASVTTSNNGRAVDLDGILSLVDLDEVVCTNNSACVELTNLAASSNTTFTGVALGCSGGVCFDANSARTLEVTGGTNVIGGINAQGLSIVNSVIGPAEVTFLAIGATGVAKGIVLNSAGSGFNITGSGTTDGTGGVITNISQRAIEIISTNDIQLRNIDLNNVATTNGADPTNDASNCGSLETGSNVDCHAGVHLQNVNGAVLTNVDIDGSAQQGINARTVSNLQVLDSDIRNVGNQVRENGLTIFNASGVLVVRDTVVNNPEDNGMRLYNNTGTLNMTVLRTTFTQNKGANGNDGLSFEIDGGTTNLLVDNSDFTNLSRDGVDGVAESGGILNATVRSSRFNNSDGFGGVILACAGASTINTRIDNNTITNNISTAINLFAAGTCDLDGTIIDNSISHPLTANIGFGVRVIQEENSDVVILTDNTDVADQAQGMLFRARSVSGVQQGTMDVTVVDNDITDCTIGFQVDAGVSTGTHENVVCFHTDNGGGAGNNSTTGVGLPWLLNQRSSAVFNVQGLGGATITNHIQNNNVGSPAVGTVGTFTNAPANCAQPTATPLPPAI